nr:MAG TPA: hypothetical protein [Caudoviricetes sp.]
MTTFPLLYLYYTIPYAESQYGKMTKVINFIAIFLCKSWGARAS